MTIPSDVPRPIIHCSAASELVTFQEDTSCSTGRYDCGFATFGGRLYMPRGTLLHTVSTSLQHGLGLVLRDLAMALKYIHDSGWVHRDISAGNIYFFDGRGLIGDLEYANEVTKDGSHQMRTGTPDFMAIEVSTNCHQFLPTFGSMGKLGELLNEVKDGTFQEVLPAIHFVQNEAHDMESLWWIALYILFFNCDDGAVETPTQHENRIKWMQMIFPSSPEVTERISFLRSQHIYEERTSWFSHSFLSLRRALGHIRDALTKTYADVEKRLPNVATGAFDELHEFVIRAFEIGREKSDNIRILSCKTKGRQRQKDLTQSFAPPPPPPLAEASDETSETVPKLTDVPRLPEDKENICVEVI